MNAPSAYAMETAMSALMSARARLLNDDPELAEDEAALDALLPRETADVDELLARIARAACHAGLMKDAAKIRIDQMRGRKERYQRREELLRGVLLSALDALGRARLELPDMTVSIGGVTRAVQVTDASVLPDAYVNVTREPNKSAIAAAIKAGEVVPGAMLSNGLPSVRIHRS